jgi:ATP-dependent Clp protease ATP-binding subunit ClpA
VIDETGAAQMLLPEKAQEDASTSRSRNTIATMARIPPKTVSKDDEELLKPIWTRN